MSDKYDFECKDEGSRLVFTFGDLRLGVHMVVDRLNNYEAENKRLRKIIEDAPHALSCDIQYANEDDYDIGCKCDCWKSEID